MLTAFVEKLIKQLTQRSCCSSLKKCAPWLGKYLSNMWWHRLNDFGAYAFHKVRNLMQCIEQLTNSATWPTVFGIEVLCCLLAGREIVGNWSNFILKTFHWCLPGEIVGNWSNFILKTFHWCLQVVCSWACCWIGCSSNTTCWRWLWSSILSYEICDFEIKS